VYVTGDKAAVVVPRSISTARYFLKQEDKIRLPSNHHLYDLLAQAKVVEADENRQCVKRIRVRGKRGPVELYALIFATNTIIPQAILPTLPTVAFEVVPEEPKQPDAKASDSMMPSAAEEPRGWGECHWGCRANDSFARQPANVTFASTARAKRGEGLQ
jgi:hypothetical protein